MLARDPDVKQILESERLPVEKLPTSWFLASEVHLRGSNERDLVVVGTGPVSGANVTTFWIFRPRGRRFELLLNAPAHWLEIKEARSNGYKDIELVSATAVTVSTVLCEFEGVTYKPSSKTLNSIP